MRKEGIRDDNIRDYCGNIDQFCSGMYQWDHYYGVMCGCGALRGKVGYTGEDIYKKAKAGVCGYAGCGSDPVDMSEEFYFF